MELKNLVFVKEGNIAVITINRPKALNALNSETLVELEMVIDSLAKERDIYAVVLTGSGEKAFVAGADISEMKDLSGMEGREFGILGNRVFRKIETLEKPVIAA